MGKLIFHTRVGYDSREGISIGEGGVSSGAWTLLIHPRAPLPVTVYNTVSHYLRSQPNTFMLILQSSQGSTLL